MKGFRKLVTIGLVSLLFVSTFASIGYAKEGMDSGGGKGLVCFNEKEVAEEVKENDGIIRDRHLESITFIETLDLYYAKLPRGIDVKVPELVKAKQGEGFWEFYNRIFGRIEMTIPQLANGIYSAQSEFTENEIVWAEMGVLPVLDENTSDVVHDDNCTLTTIAVQFKEEGRNFLHIDPRLFFHPHMSVLSQASLLLHEFVYLIARKQGKGDSRSTRKLVGLLLRNEGKQTIVNLAQAAAELNFIPKEMMKKGALMRTSFVEHIQTTLFEQVISADYVERQLTLKLFDYLNGSEVQQIQDLYTMCLEKLSETNLDELSSQEIYDFIGERLEEELANHHFRLVSEIAYPVIQ